MTERSLSLNDSDTLRALLVALVESAGGDVTMKYSEYLNAREGLVFNQKAIYGRHTLNNGFIELRVETRDHHHAASR